MSATGTERLPMAEGIAQHSHRGGSRDGEEGQPDEGGSGRNEKEGGGRGEGVS